MSFKKLNIKSLDQILEKIVDTVDDSKSEIFRIGEQCRDDYAKLQDELKQLKINVKRVIAECDKLEIKARYARTRLSKVSQNFEDYTEEEVKNAYETAHQIQTELTINREHERQLRLRRDDIERQLQGLTDTIERAEHLVSQTTVVLNYLNNDLRYVGEIIDDARQKQEFGLKVIEAQEDERKRLSREIHDGPAQMLANVMMRSDLIEKIYYERSGEEAIQEIRSLKKTVRSALYEVRRIIYDLRPMALDDLGLIPTLKKYLQTIEDYHKEAEITFVYIGQEQRLPSNYEVALFRLVQESVTNALKHAEAKLIQVKLEIKRTNIIVVIKDDGRGFNVNERRRQSFGIIGMEERVELLDGTISIDSQIGSGTTVIIQVPLL